MPSALSKGMKLNPPPSPDFPQRPKLLDMTASTHPEVRRIVDMSAVLDATSAV